MTMWEKLAAVLKREGSDVKEGLSHVGRTLDEELARKERELQATPTERLEMILQDIEADDGQLQEIERSIGGQPDRGPQPRPEPTHQLLDEDDVSDSPHLKQALESVTVRYEHVAEGPESATHTVVIDEAAWRTTTSDFVAIAEKIGAYTLVSGAHHSAANMIAVRAEHLHVEDVRLLAAAALAEQRPPP